MVYYSTNLNHHKFVVFLYLTQSQYTIKGYTNGHLTSIVCIPSPSFTDCVRFTNNINVTLPSVQSSGAIYLVPNCSGSNLSIAWILMQQGLSHRCYSLPPLIVTLPFWDIAAAAMPTKYMITHLPVDCSIDGTIWWPPSSPHW